MVIPEFKMQKLWTERKCRSAHLPIICRSFFHDRSMPSVIIQHMGEQVFDLLLHISEFFWHIANPAFPPLSPQNIRRLGLLDTAGPLHTEQLKINMLLGQCIQAAQKFFHIFFLPCICPGF